MALETKGTSASAQQLAITFKVPLTHLCKRSSNAGASWDVSVGHPHEVEYEYEWRGQRRIGARFVCTLLSPDSPEHYCLAQFKKTATNVQKYEQAKNKFADGARFSMSQVGFAEDTNLQYSYVPRTKNVDLSRTTMIAVIEPAEASAAQPAPSTSVANGNWLGGNQFFDGTTSAEQPVTTLPAENIQLLSPEDAEAVKSSWNK